jgi:LacI family transcriptional regulator, galactose operon repressor
VRPADCDHERADSWTSIARTISAAAVCAGRVRSTARVRRRLPSKDRISRRLSTSRGARDLVEHLITVHGHQSIALIMGESSEPIPEPREQGWSAALQAHDLPPGLIVRTSFSRHGGYEAAMQLLNWPTRPSAIFAASDQLCTGALKAVPEAGLRCPDDIAVVSFDGTSESEYCWPPLTVARQPIQAMAEAAVSMVLNPSLSSTAPALRNGSRHS